MKELVLIENDIKPVKTALDGEMTKALKHFEGELVKIRTGRAHTSLVEDVAVSSYGAAPMPLKQLAALSAPESRLLVIQPWDVGIIADIEKAILTSDVGLKPVNDGKVIRLQLPEMSSARREDLVKVLGKRLEECRISIRNVRRDVNNLLRDAKKDKKISENFLSRLTDLVQEVTDSFIAQAEALASKKEKDIRTV